MPATAETIKLPHTGYRYGISDICFATCATQERQNLTKPKKRNAGVEVIGGREEEAPAG